MGMSKSPCSLLYCFNWLRRSSHDTRVGVALRLGLLPLPGGAAVTAEFGAEDDPSAVPAPSASSLPFETFPMSLALSSGSEVGGSLRLRDASLPSFSLLLLLLLLSGVAELETGGAAGAGGATGRAGTSGWWLCSRSRGMAPLTEEVRWDDDASSRSGSPTAANRSSACSFHKSAAAASVSAASDSLALVVDPWDGSASAAGSAAAVASSSAPPVSSGSRAAAESSSGCGAGGCEEAGVARSFV